MTSLMHSTKLKNTQIIEFNTVLHKLFHKKKHRESFIKVPNLYTLSVAFSHYNGGR